ncbi:glycosyltransferase family 4 protein [Bacillus thermocopriae]|uniref:Glycosyltransferase family 4 protein n=1 Tax=Neobacillus thermocopriae TaxID=1215031 RepID=A0A6B3TKM8_9BACI|nr:glycosyltransferase family 4 protein [Neobacillus thermocopriae]NEX77484.1 glycosyltransferase family 4 protein [Neobacillus thermocopriae]
MKIFLISNMYPNKEYPNFGIFVKNTEEILKNQGWVIDKVVLHKSQGKAKKLLAYLLYYLKILIKGLFGKYDAIYIHFASVHNALPLIFLKKLRGNLNIITNVHGSDVVPQVATQEKYMPYVKKLLEISTVIITPSYAYKRLVAEKYGVGEVKIQVFPSGGVNKNIFYQEENKLKVFEELKLNPNLKYIGYVGRIDVGKGWEIVLSAVKKLKDLGYFQGWKLIVAGKGSQQKDYERLVAELELENDIVYFPLLPQEKLRKIYNCLEVFCFPSRAESLGLVGLEAMACGVPVIGSKVGGLLDYIRNGENGLFFEVGNDEDLKNKLIQFMTMDDQQKARMQKEALKTAEEYEAEAVKPQLIEIFKGYQRSVNDGN